MAQTTSPSMTWVRGLQTPSPSMTWVCGLEKVSRSAGGPFGVVALHWRGVQVHRGLPSSTLVSFYCSCKALVSVVHEHDETAGMRRIAFFRWR